VERWRSDCGCKTRGDWHQKWRGPLRSALDGLKEQLDHLFGTRGRVCFRDPWAARDGYIDVILSRYSEEAIKAFLAEYGHPDLDERQTTDALRLLEIQLDAMLMYTSCGWFFDEISGLETTQCLQYAARAISLSRQFDRDLEEGFVAALEAAPSNLPMYGDGRGVWEQCIRPSVVDLDRVLAHHAISLIYQQPDEEDRPDDASAYDVQVLDQEIRNRGVGHLAVGRLRARSRRTWNEAESNFVVVHFGGLDFHAILSSEMSAEDFREFQPRLLAIYRSGSMAELMRMLDQEFPGAAQQLDDLFRDEQRRIVGIVLSDRFEDYRRAFEHLANEDEEVLNRLGRLRYPIPKPLRAAASTYLDHHLREQIDWLETGEENSLTPLEHLCDRGRSWGYTPEREALGKAVSEGLSRTLRSIRDGSDLVTVAARVELLLDAAALLNIKPDLWRVQNQFLDAYIRLSDDGAVDPALRGIFDKLAVRLDVNPAVLDRRP
jgi:hypothetical protein